MSPEVTQLPTQLADNDAISADQKTPEVPQPPASQEPTENMNEEGADPEEVATDLRSHVEEELRLSGAAIADGEEVRKILSRMSLAGQVGEHDEKKPDKPDWASSDKGRILPFAWLGGVLLPGAALVIELVTHMCAETFFNPLPTFFHSLLVASVVLMNAIALVFLSYGRTPGLSLLRTRALGLRQRNPAQVERDRDREVQACPGKTTRAPAIALGNERGKRPADGAGEAAEQRQDGPDDGGDDDERGHDPAVAEGILDLDARFLHRPRRAAHRQVAFCLEVGHYGLVRVHGYAYRVPGSSNIP